jgi:hypothetical protein
MRNPVVFISTLVKYAYYFFPLGRGRGVPPAVQRGVFRLQPPIRPGLLSTLITLGKNCKTVLECELTRRAWDLCGCVYRYLHICIEQGPYNCNLLVAGYDNDAPSLYYVDYLSCLHKMNCSGHGYGESPSLAGLCQLPRLPPQDELFWPRLRRVALPR